MPRYFFDLQDGEFVPDDVGVELADINAARREAAVSLGEFAKDVLSNADHREVMVCVREEVGPVLFSAKLTYEMIDGSH